MSSFPNVSVGNPRQGDFLDPRLKHSGTTAYSRYDAFMRWLLVSPSSGKNLLVTNWANRLSSLMMSHLSSPSTFKRHYQNQSQLFIANPASRHLVEICF